MELLLIKDDYSGVLHTSASIFETLAKIVINIPTIEDQTFKSFFERYKKDSQLPEELLKLALEIYDKRNASRIVIMHAI